MDKLDCMKLDSVLSSFKYADIISKEIMFKNAPKGYGSAIKFLVREGFLENHEAELEITYKGKSFIEDGGFVGKRRNERIQFYCTIAAAAAGILSLLVALIAFFL